MVLKFKPKISRYHPEELSKGWGILDNKTGEILKDKDRRNRIERYGSFEWAKQRCKQLNQED